VQDQESAIIVNGEALIKVAATEEIKEAFLELAAKAKVILACRVSPK
jgi:hypothetical protein